MWDDPPSRGVMCSRKKTAGRSWCRPFFGAVFVQHVLGIKKAVKFQGGRSEMKGETVLT